MTKPPNQCAEFLNFIILRSLIAMNLVFWSALINITLVVMLR